uniref:Uncharacterized protein n=1 Tax=Anguilla anguilla TaxID=7936 RepID=A0A0E9SNA7_ANGAN
MNDSSLTESFIACLSGRGMCNWLPKTSTSQKRIPH